MKTLETRFHPALRRQHRHGSAVLVIFVLLAAVSLLVIANTHTLHLLKQELRLLDERQKQRLHSGSAL